MISFVSHCNNKDENEVGLRIAPETNLDIIRGWYDYIDSSIYASELSAVVEEHRIYGE
jgi:hypothetical protein